MHRLLAALLLLAIPAAAQDFPNRPVTLIAAGAAGGPTDVITRLVAEGMTADLGQQVVVESIGGATVGPNRAAQARPDGYTLLLNNIGFAASATLYRRLPYDVLESFAPLGLVSEAAMTLVARPGFPARDFQGFLQALRDGGEQLNLATSGLGSASQFCGLMLQHAVGAKLTTVAFRGSAPAMTDLLAGRLDLFCDQATNTVPYIRDGRIQAYAVTSEARVPGLDLPTTAEAGLPALAMNTWHGLYAPRGTPDAVQERLSAALRAALRTERLRQRFAELVTDPAPQDRATIAFHRRFLAAEVARWRPIIVAAGVYAD